MPLSAPLKFDHPLIAERGGNLCGEDRFSIESCNRCQGHYLYNDELKDVYYDPEDLGRHFFKIPAMRIPPCRHCGAIEWDFADAVIDQATAQSGPWGWSLASRVFTFTD